MEYIIQIVSCGVGALGYALVYNVKRDKLIVVTIGGLLTITAYVIINNMFNNILLATTISSALITFYSEILARYLKSPATVFLLPGIIPLVPGGGLFYTMTGLLKGNMTQFNSYGISTFETAAGIAIGVILASVIVHHVNNRLRKRKEMQYKKYSEK
ncbi:MAG: threonine/serine exporter family protein [Sarcina sp.]